MQQRKGFTRRQFIKTSAAGVAAFTIVPRHVIGKGETPPSETFGGALIGCGGRGNGTFGGLGPDVKKLAQCDVKFLNHADNKTIYTDFRRVLERKDIDVVAIATPPHWHALISIAAMEAGKDVLCEKPMTRFIAEGRAVAEAERRTGQIFQIGTYGRFSADRKLHKLMTSGLVKENPVVYMKKGGFKVVQWSGMINPKPQKVPSSLDWDMYCGPAPLRPYHPHRFGGSHRGYWDYEGGGLADMSQHYLDGFQYAHGKDDTSPVEVEANAPTAHPEACGMWGWIELKYADGLTLVLDSGEWGEPYSRKQARGMSENDLSEADRAKLNAMPDPEPLVGFPEAIRTRKRASGNADNSNRCATLMHLSNIAIRTGRKIKYDPVAQQIIGDEQANRLVNPPMRAPWRL
jgi:predicted dehydrogenase